MNLDFHIESTMKQKALKLHLKYLCTSIEDEGGMETEITKRVRAGWINWKKCSETGVEGLQNSGRVSNAPWERNVG